MGSLPQTCDYRLFVFAYTTPFLSISLLDLQPLYALKHQMPHSSVPTSFFLLLVSVSIEHTLNKCGRSYRVFFISGLILTLVISVSSHLLPLSLYLLRPMSCFVATATCFNAPIGLISWLSPVYFPTMHCIPPPLGC